MLANFFPAGGAGNAAGAASDDELPWVTGSGMANVKPDGGLKAIATAPGLVGAVTDG